MPKRSSKRDDLQNALRVVEEAIGSSLGKNPAAVALGRRGGLKGGPARAAELSPENRKKIAQKAAKARWAKARKRVGGAVHLWLSVLRLAPSNIQWFAYTVRKELRSLYSRIGVLRDRKKTQMDGYDGKSVDLGPLLEPEVDYEVSADPKLSPQYHLQAEPASEHLAPCIETLSRSRDIENLFSKFPWASDADVLLFLEGWEMGRQSAHGSVCSKNMEPQQAYSFALRLAALHG